VKSSQEHDFVKFEDLKGKSLGVYKGYTYHPTIMQMIKNGDIHAVNVSDIDHGAQLLLLDRIDALIDFDILLDYKIKTEYADKLALADLYAESYDLYCAYSKKISIDKAQIHKVFEDLISTGQIKSLLKQYN
jgi:ABC-type amino acid transport substrate-binding protein